MLYCLYEALSNRSSGVFVDNLIAVLVKTTVDLPVESALWFLPALFLRVFFIC